MDEFRLALRRLSKRPVTTVVGVLALAVGIGASAATWALLSAVFVHPLPLKHPDKLQMLGEVRTREGQPGTTYNNFVYPLYPFIRDSGVFQSVIAQWPVTLQIDDNGVPSSELVVFATHDFFQVLEVSVPVGRGFREEDDRRGATPVAVLTDRYWHRAFSADSNVIGRTVTIRSKRVTIVGVAAPGFRGIDLSQDPDLFIPFQTIADVAPSVTNYFGEPNRGSSPTAGLVIIGRLRGNETAPQAVARLSSLDVPAGRQSKPVFVLTELNTAAIPPAARPDMSQFSRLLALTVGLLLLTGCGTVGILLLLRTEARRDEFAVCLALGASRSRLVKGIVIEGALLAVCGAALALPIASGLFSGARAFQLPGHLSIELLGLTLDSRTLMEVLGSAACSMFLISLVAGGFGFSVDIREGLRSRSTATPNARRPTRAVLISGQVAIALVLLSGAGLFIRSLLAAMRLNTGMDTTGVITGTIALGQYIGKYDEPRAAAFFEDLFNRLSANPAIRSMAFSVRQGGMTSAGKLMIDGIPRQFPSTAWITMVNPDYFHMMKIPLLKGRDFSTDDRSNGKLVTIVSESFGRMLANGDDPLGSRIEMPYHKQGSPPDVAEVVGVVGDVVRDVSVLEPLDMYFPAAQMAPVLSREVAIRPAGDLETTRREILSAIKQIDPIVTPTPLLTLEQRIDNQMGTQKFGASIMGALGLIAVFLTLLGIYVLAESMTAMRLRELGIRAALGANRRQLAALILRETFRLVGAGLAVGFLLTWAGAGTIRALLFQVQPLDPSTISLVAFVIFVLAIVVSLRPALRATRVDINRVLRED